MAVIPSFDQHADGTRERQSREVRHAPTHTLVDTDERDLKIQRALDDRCLAAVQAIAQVGGIAADSPRRSSQSAPSNAATPGASLSIAWISSTSPPEILLPGERHGREVSAWRSAKRTRRLRMRRRARAPDRGRSRGSASDPRRIHADDGMQRGANSEVEGIGLAGLVPRGCAGGVGRACAASRRRSRAATRSRSASWSATACPGAKRCSGRSLPRGAEQWSRATPAAAIAIAGRLAGIARARQDRADDALAGLAGAVGDAVVQPQMHPCRRVLPVPGVGGRILEQAFAPAQVGAVAGR
jgi:hypothetical protein